MNKAIIIILFFFVGCNLFAQSSTTIHGNQNFTPGKVWNDTDGVPINAHGGGMIQYEGRYYWFGEHKISGPDGNRAMVGFSCYSSDNLYDWKNEGIALAVSEDTTSPIRKGCIMERPKVIYNKSTSQSVMWFHHELSGTGYRTAASGIAVSKRITGPYTYLKTIRPNAGYWPVNVLPIHKLGVPSTTKEHYGGGPGGLPGHPDTVNLLGRDFSKGQMARDMTLFVDTDGKAYHIYSSEENSTTHISLLTDDYLSFAGKYTRVFVGRYMEAPTLFRYKGNYFFIGSGCTGWDPNAARSAVAPSIWGPWTELGNPCRGTDAENEKTFWSQSTYILPVAGKKDAFIFMADRWNPENPIDGRYVWLPLQFDQDGKPIIKWLERWNLDTFQSSVAILPKSDFRHYIDQFNRQDTAELHVDVIPGTRMIRNADSWQFLEENIPFFECPDKEIEEVYYYRWWTFRKHLKQTHEGYVITEFMPNVSWAGKYNTISCPAMHHFREGRWLQNPAFVWDYGRFWLRGGGDPYVYSFPIAESFLQMHMVHPDMVQLISFLPDLQANFSEWERRRREPDGLFWQHDGQDGMEVAIGGTGKRPTINSYMFADARAIAAIAQMKGEKEIADRFSSEAEKMRTLTLNHLWDKEASFFKVIPKSAYTLPGKRADSLSTARELLGYVPWYVELPPAGRGYEVAWKQLMDPQGFYAPFGPTTAEQRHPGFKISYEGHECQWNGPSWPFATAQTLTALANVLNDYPQKVVDKEDFFETLKIYSHSHRFRQVPPAGDTLITNDLWIDENLNPYSGDWLARTRMEVQKYNHGFRERGIYYNHSTYCDIIITGLAGLRPSLDNVLTINPLVPDDWDWFCLDDVQYKGHTVTILWDRTGRKYNRGKGLIVFLDGKPAAISRKIQKLTVNL